MNLNYLARGSATLACAILLTSVVSPAQAVTPTNPSSFTIPMNPVENSDSSKNNSSNETDQLDAEILKANEELTASLAETLRANNSYSDSLLVLEQRNAEAEKLSVKAKEAEKDRTQAKQSAGQLAASLYKNGGIDLDVQTFLTTDDADEAIYKTATMQKFTESTATTVENAENSAKISSVMQEQADKARVAADEAAKNAEELKNTAESANIDQEKLVQQTQIKREELLETLATLRNTTVEDESARVESFVAQAQEEKFAEILQDSSNLPQLEVPRNNVQAPVGNSQSPVQTPNPVVQQPAAPSQPVIPAPVAPAQPSAPVAPVAPKPNPSAPTAPSNSYIQVMVNFALAQSGKAYAWGGNGPNAYDCSGLVQQAFAAAGKAVPRTGTEQFWAAPQRVPLSQAQYGDLVVFDHDGNGNFGHIAIYVGNGKAVQALYYGYPVGTYAITSMTNTVYPYVARY